MPVKMAKLGWFLAYTVSLILIVGGYGLSASAVGRPAAPGTWNLGDTALSVLLGGVVCAAGTLSTAAATRLRTRRRYKWLVGTALMLCAIPVLGYLAILLLALLRIGYIF